MVIEAKTDLQVCGSIYPATAMGFQRFLAEANQYETRGYQVIGLLRLDKGFGAVYRRVHPERRFTESSSFFE